MTKDVVVRLVGGLGNQMFQYAAGFAVAQRSGAPLMLDVSWFATANDRHFALGPMRISAGVLGALAAESGPILRVLRKVVHKLTKRTDELWQDRPVFREKHFHFDKRILELRAPVCLDGYFQSESNFAEFGQLVSQEFTLATEPNAACKQMLDKIVSCDAICLHVRRGDYVASATTNAFHGTCSLQYYHDGLRLVTSGLENPHCFIFSDDPQWVRANFQPECAMTVVDINGADEAHEDLRLMSACKHFVIANSSLSWWGAWLGTHAGKQVVSPKNWFQNGTNNTADLRPKSWIQL